jgi:phenylalanyl-tRNA synthetase beta chain
LVKGEENLMPTITLNLKDLEKMIGKKLPRSASELDEAFECVKAEVEDIKGDELKLEIKGNDRPDIWNVEGIVRQMKGQLETEMGLVKYKINDSKYEVKVKDIDQRKFIACAVVKDVEITPYILEQLIQQQEKIHGTYGRKRKRASIGLYDADMITFPLKYTTVDPTKVKFIPLGWEKKANLKQIIEEHEKGKEFASILQGQQKYPIFVDSKEKILSFPPIINSNDLGNITPGKKNILIEVTGTEFDIVKNVLNIMVISLADRGGKIYSVRISSPYKTCVTPLFVQEKIDVKLSDINSRIGMNFTIDSAKKLLRKARYGVETKGNKFIIEIPFYRTDIMHPVDIIEDVAIAYGFNKFVPDAPELYTLGGLTEKTKLSNKVRQTMIGFGMQEVMTFTFVSEKILADNVGLKPKLTQVINPMNENYTSLRNAIIPTMLDFLGKNQHNKFPQAIFEVGNCVVDLKDKEKLACLIAKDQANYTEIKAILEALVRSLGIEITISPIKHPTFIEGRCAEIKQGKKHLGVIGEVHPKVLGNFGIEKPVVGFEIGL